MTCHRTAATRAAFEAGTLGDDEVLVRHVQGCDDCGRIVAAAQLDDLGHGAVDDDADAIALAALGLGPMPDGVDALDRAFLDDLVNLPAGMVPPMPADLVPLDSMLDASTAAPIADRASALSRPMAMIPPEEMIDPEAPTDARIGALPPARRRWGPWFAAIGTMAAAAVVLFALLPDELQQMDAPLPLAASDEAPVAPAIPPVAPATPPTAPAKPAEAEKGADSKPRAAGPAADGEGADNAASDDPPAIDPPKPVGDPPAAAEKPAEDEKVAAAPTPARKPARRSRASRSKPAAAAPKPAAKPAARAARRPAKKESASEVDDLLGALDGAGGGSKSRAAAPAAPAPSGEPLLPERLSRRQLLTVVKANARSVAACNDGTRGSGGTYKVEIVIAKSGRVTSATVKSGQKGSPVVACVEREVRAFRFPQFSGDPMRIMMPFSL